MNSPKFAVYEEVVLVSESYPEYNGYYYIEKVITTEEYIKLHPNTTYTGEFYYKLEDLSIKLSFVHTGLPTGNVTSYVREAFLRKKHKPSEFGSFTNLMNNLKLPQKTPQEVK